MQCGICTPGFIVAAKALLDKNPNPSEHEIRFELAGNLCRCTGYDKIINGIPTLEDLETRLGSLEGKRILVRTDFNVPIAGGEISDDFRIRAALPTLQWLQERGAGVVAASHLGRPKGAPDPKYSMEPVRTRLAELAPGVELLDNLRFDAGEEGNDDAFVRRLVAGVDGYVNDAFGASHRAHASIVGPPRHVPSAMGRLLAREVEVLVGIRNDPKRPFVAVLGGAKVSDKLGVIEALLDTVDALAVGGAMCFTFFVRAWTLHRQLVARAGPDRDLPAAAGGDHQGHSLADRHRRSRPVGPRGHVRHPPARRRQGPRHRSGHRGRVR